LKRVLLFSGGVDSSALALLWPHDSKLYVDMRTRYSEAEKAHLGGDVAQVELPLTRWERADGIIPMRNLFLVAIASLYGEQIALGAVAGERMLDKTPMFAKMASEILDYLWQAGEPGRRPQGWTQGREIKVELPVVHLTKAELIREVVKVKGIKATTELADRAWSCYEPVEGPSREGLPLQQCGRCKPCIRNWLAFYNSFIYLPYTPPVELLEPFFHGRGEESAIAKRAAAELSASAGRH